MLSAQPINMPHQQVLDIFVLLCRHDSDPDLLDNL